MELNEKIWLAEAERLTDNTAAWMSGAQSMLTSVEKMLISYKEKYQTIIDNRNSIQEERNHARVMLAHTNKQLQELKSIQPLATNYPKRTKN